MATIGAVKILLVAIEEIEIATGATISTLEAVVVAETIIELETTFEKDKGTTDAAAMIRCGVIDDLALDGGVGGLLGALGSGALGNHDCIRTRPTKDAIQDIINSGVCWLVVINWWVRRILVRER